MEDMKLSPKDFMHPKGQAALEHLKAIPAFDQIVEKILAKYCKSRLVIFTACFLF